MDIRDRRSYRTCPIERIDEPSHGSHALLWRHNGALGLPISALTHPGLTKTQGMPRGAKSIADRITMFTAALELR
jgi:hypothetical protein